MVNSFWPPLLRNNQRYWYSTSFLGNLFYYGKTVLNSATVKICLKRGNNQSVISYFTDFVGKQPVRALQCQDQSTTVLRKEAVQKNECFSVNFFDTLLGKIWNSATLTTSFDLFFLENNNWKSSTASIPLLIYSVSEKTIKILQCVTSFRSVFPCETIKKTATVLIVLTICLHGKQSEYSVRFGRK